MALLIAVGATVALVQWAPDWAASNVRIRPASLVLQPDLDGGSGTVLERLLRGRLRVRGQALVANDNWFDIEILRVRWTTELRGRVVAEGVLEPGPVLLSDREDKLAFGTDVLLASLGLAALDVLKVGSADVVVQLHYEAQALGLRIDGAATLRDFDLRLDTQSVPMDALITEPRPRAPTLPAVEAN